MKKLVLLSAMLFLTSITYAQNIGTLNRSKFYHIIDSGLVSHLVSPTVAAGGYSLCPGTTKLKANVTVTSAGVINVDIHQITNDPCLNSTNQLNQNTTTSLTLDNLRDSLGEPTKAYRIPFKMYNFGLLTVPFRIRGKVTATLDNVSTEIPTTATASLNTAFFGAKTWGKSSVTSRGMVNHYFSIAAFVGPTLVSLAKGNVENSTSFPGSKIDLPGGMIGAGAIFGRNNTGLLLSVGLDYVFKKDAGWVYNGKPWFGLGVVTSLGAF